jgi:hypothetical protein
MSGGGVSVYSVQYRITGTTPWLTAGQSDGSPQLTIDGLQPTTSYDFTVSGANNLGTGPVSSSLTASTLAGGLVPGAPTTVTVIIITSASVTCWWTAPTTGGSDAVYDVQYRVSGQSTWTTAAAGISAANYSISGLAPATTYDIRITASNSNGSGPPSVLTNVHTAQLAGLVSGITWNLAPTGSFAHGDGDIGLNVHVNPATSPVQFGFSASATSPPTSWSAGTLVNSDLWGQYVAVPATAGSWYGWAEGIDGSAPTVYPTPITVT